MSELNKEKLLKHLAHMFKCYEYNFINVDWKPPEEGVQAYQQMKEMIEIFHSPLGHMTKYDPEEEWIRIK